MNALARAASIDDLRILARRRVPRFAFDFVDGGAETETNLDWNQQAFREIRLVPRYLVDVSQVTTRTELFGQTYAVPFGIAPMGFLNMAWPQADLMIARLAADRNIPVVISSASSTPLEEVAQAAGGFAWFQVYISRDDALTDRLLTRAEGAGCQVLVITVDVAQTGKRDRDIRNGLKVPFTPNLRIIGDLLAHPRWALGTLRHGPPGFANFSGDKSGNLGSLPLAETQNRMISNDFTWDDLHKIRDRWKGKLLIKGILHPDDAGQAVQAGVDGIVVSNHGGRQADYGPAAISALPGVAAVVGGKVPVLLDSGIRRGADMVRAKALGADFVFAGRPFAYGLGARGAEGCARAFDILQSELVCTLGQIGQPNFASIDARMLEG